MFKLWAIIVETYVVNSSHVLQVKTNIATHAILFKSDRNHVSTGKEESLITCAEFGKDLHGVIKSLLAKQIECIEILDVMYLLLLITIWIILHLLAEKEKRKRKTKKFITLQQNVYSLFIRMWASKNVKTLWMAFFILGNAPGELDC